MERARAWEYPLRNLLSYLSLFFFSPPLNVLPLLFFAPCLYFMFLRSTITDDDPNNNLTDSIARCSGTATQRAVAEAEGWVRTDVLEDN